MATAVTQPERHLHSVPALPNPLPWWCRTFGHTFGHTFIRQPTVRINTTRWNQPTSVPLTVMCRRCGTRP